MLRKSHTYSAVLDKTVFILALHCFGHLKTAAIDISRQFENSLF